MEQKQQITMQIRKMVRGMPMAVKIAAVWAANNADLILQLLENSRLEEEERKRCMDTAWEKQEYKLWVMLLYQQFQQEGHQKDSKI